MMIAEECDWGSPEQNNRNGVLRFSPFLSKGLQGLAGMCAT
jgi:hypothetical protein